MYIAILSAGGYVTSVCSGAVVPSEESIEIDAEIYAKIREGGIAQYINGEVVIIDAQVHLRSKLDLLADVAAQRYQVETAGIAVNGRRINTEREAQSKLNSAFVSLQAGLIPFTDWKADDGSWVKVDLEGLRSIATAVAQHVAACYTAEMQHQDAIKLLKTQAQIDAYDVTTGWPD